MHLGTRHPRLRKALSFSTLAVFLAFTSLTVTQCTMVGDRLTGVQPLHHDNPQRCFERCRDIYRASIFIENIIHQIKLQQCHNSASCITAENARHAAALARIEQRRNDCLNDCHHQGGGGGGN
jgi:hypothetical protein